MVLGFSVLSAQWPTSPEEPGVSVGQGYGLYHSISDGEGGVWVGFVSWEDFLKVQHIDKYGYVSWDNPVTPHGVYTNSDTIWLVTGGALANDGNGGVYVAYSIAIYNTPYIDPDHVYDFDETIYLQHLDSLGNKLWGEWGITVTLPESYLTGISRWWFSSCRILADETGGIYIIWRDWRNGGYSLSHPFGQRLDYYGNKMWDSTGVQLLDMDSDITVRSVVSDGQGGIIVQTGGYNRLQRVGPSGQLLWGDTGLPLSIEGHSWGWGKIRSDHNGGCIVIERLQHTGTDSSGIWVEWSYNLNRMNNNGELLWGFNGVSTDDFTRSNIFNLAIHDDGSVNFLYGGKTIARITAGGEMDWTINNSNASITGLSIIASEDNSVLLFGFINYSNLYVKKIAATGNYLWDGDSVRFGGGPYVTDCRGGAICVSLSNNRQISRNGNLGEVLLSTENPNDLMTPAEFILYRNYPNPFNPNTTLSFDLPEASVVTLTIYNLTGREVKTLADKPYRAGKHHLQWNGTNNSGAAVASGMYLYTLTSHSINGKTTHRQTHKIVLLK